MATNSTMTKADFNAMLARVLAKAKADKHSESNSTKEIASIASNISNLKQLMTDKGVTHVDTDNIGITAQTLKTDDGQDQAVETIKEIITTAIPVEAEAIKPEPIIGVTREIMLNDKQQSAHDKIVAGDSTVVIGAAGTGKTTSMRKTTRTLIDTKTLPILQTSTKVLSIGSPGCVIVSFTRKAVNNIRHAVVEELKANTTTLHKLLEFEPEFYEIEDPDNPGKIKTTMRFVPARDRTYPLPKEIQTVIFEESSMISVALYNMLQDAMPHEHQEVFLGDIQQLPPTFGVAVLGFKMLELPVIELTEIYRQAAASPIISLAWKLLEGNPHTFSSKSESYKVYNEYLKKEVSRIKCPALDALSIKNEAGEIKIHIWQKPLSADLGLITICKQFNTWADAGFYNPDDDIILCPFNKAFGTIELNKGLQQHLGVKRGAVVHEVIAGFNKHYLAIGDRVLYDKEDAFIIDIHRNGQYLGKAPVTASNRLDRWGSYQEKPTDVEKLNAKADMDANDIDLDQLMNLAATSEEDRVQAASHIVTIRYEHSDEEASLESAAEINNLLGGNAITVHKAQGSEYKRVFFVMHNSHAVMNSRELLYTACTRAREFLYIICEPTTLEKGVKSQRIKGNTLAEKAENFKGKQDGTIPIKSSHITRVKINQKITEEIREEIIQPIQIIEQNIQISKKQESKLFSTREIAMARLAEIKAKKAGGK